MSENCFNLFRGWFLMASITSATSLSGIPPITSSIIINLILVSFISVTSVNQFSLRILIRFFVFSWE